MDAANQRSIPGPPCAIRFLLDNCTPEDNQTIMDAMQMIEQHRETNPRESNKPPNTAWLIRLIHTHMDIQLPRDTLSRHMRKECKCYR